MKPIPEYLSGSHDSELRVLVAEARGWTNVSLGVTQRGEHSLTVYGISRFDTCRMPVPPFELSRDACEELLAELTEEEKDNFAVQLANIILERYIGWWDLECHEAFLFLRATARQICVAYLIVKGVLK